MELVEQLSVQGNVSCLYCGEGDECEMSGLKMFYGPDAKTSEIGYTRVEDQEKVRAEAVQIGRRIGERLQKQQHGPLN